MSTASGPVFDVVDQAAFWNGPIGETWVREAARLERGFAPMTAALLEAAAPQPGEAVLDLGCGAGALSVELARRVGPSGHVHGVDISRPMLALARRRGEELRVADPAAAPIGWTEGDAARLALAPDRNLLVSRFGAMFFDAPADAFRSLRGALRSGGRIALLCWQEVGLNGWTFVPLGAVAARFGPPEPTPPFAPGPFAFADADRTLSILAEAGFVDLAAEPLTTVSRIGEDAPGQGALEDAVAYAMSIGPVPRYLRGRDELRDGAREAVREALAPYLRDGAVDLPAACWIYRGRNP